MGDGWDCIPADVLTTILQRIQLIYWRWLRLVCRHWRDVIDERMPEPRAHAKVLAVYDEGYRSRAFVVDGLIPGGRVMELNLTDRDSVTSSHPTRVIGTCNGLICLLHERRIAVINPVIREMITVMDPPTTTRWPYHWHEPTHYWYSFGCHPATRRYKILHLPYYAEFNAVHVFTLGGRSWREVPAPAGSSCNVRFGFVSIHGVTYWVTRDSKQIMSFNLKSDRVEMVKCPQIPVLPTEGNGRPCHLTDVRGRVGLAVGCPHDDFNRSKTEVWVLEGGGEELQTWANRYTVLAHGVHPRQDIALPHVIHGEHILTTYRLPDSAWEVGLKLTLNAHLPRAERKTRPCLMLRLGAPSPETVACVFDAPSLQTFPYIETM